MRQGATESYDDDDSVVLGQEALATDDWLRCKPLAWVVGKFAPVRFVRSGNVQEGDECDVQFQYTNQNSNLLNTRIVYLYVSFVLLFNFSPEQLASKRAWQNN